jgi:hypothetical protein
MKRKPYSKPKVTRTCLLSMRNEPRMAIYTFHRSMWCPECDHEHVPNEVTHVFRVDDLGVWIPHWVCNGCHGLQRYLCQ